MASDRLLGMCMFSSRKAMLFNIMVVFFTVAVLVYAFIVLNAKVDDITKEIGESPFEVIAEIQEGEKALIFLDFASQMAAYQAIYEIQSGAGIETQCGVYYGYPMWNTGAGDTCFVSMGDVEESLKNFFVSNLVARIAAYPSADFVGRSAAMAYSMGEVSAYQTGVQQGVSVEQPGVAVQGCSGGADYMKDFTYESDSGFYPPEGGRVWIPAEANCAGAYPLVIYLHGCMKSGNAYAHRNFGDGELKDNPNDLLPIAKSLISNGKVAPVIMAAPSQTKGKATRSGQKNSPCGASLWGPTFDITEFVELVKANLPSGVQVSSVSVFGHSGAGCAGNSGIYSTAKKMGTFALGQFDTCYGSAFGRIIKDNIGSSRLLIIYGAMSGDDDAQNKVLGISEGIQCPTSSIGVKLEDCKSNAEGTYLAYHVPPGEGKKKQHADSLIVGSEQFLMNFFSAASTT